jgi:ribosomal protein L11 methyltransferase
MQGDAKLLLPLIAPVNIILANILASVHVDLLQVMKDSLTSDGRAVLSGILSAEQAWLIDHLEPRGWQIIDEDVEDIWWSATLSRR